MQYNDDDGSSTDQSKLKRKFEKCQQKTKQFFVSHWLLLKTAVLVAMVMAYAAYFAYALYYDFGDESSIRLLWVTMAVVVCFALCIVQDHFGDILYDTIAEPVVQFVNDHWRICKW